MRVLVVGASGASGRAAVHALHAHGHEATAMVRRIDGSGDGDFPAGVRLHVGDALVADDVAHGVAGHDAVVVTLGIRENPIRVRLWGSARTHARVRSLGTANVVQAMHAAGVQRLIVQSSYGVGATRGLLDTKWRLIFALLLRPQIDDHERQERIVRDSAMDWTILQPVGLTDTAAGAADTVMVSTTAARLPSMRLARTSLARVIVDAVGQPWPRLRGSVALCEAPQAAPDRPRVTSADART